MPQHSFPPLPFAADAESAGRWLEGVPLGNLRESCRQLFPALQGLRAHPLEPRVRHAILERFRPLVFALARGLVANVPDPGGPADEKARKIAGLAARFHLEAGLAYLKLVEAAAFAEAFTVEERAGILQRALEQVAHHRLRSAQVDERPASAAAAALRTLYRYARAHGLLDRAAPGQALALSPRSWIEGILLFGLAAPGRLTREEMERLFEALTRAAPAAGSVPGGRLAFCFDAEDPELLVPALPFLAGLAALDAGPRLQALGQALEPRLPLHPALPRLGERLPCRERAGSRPAVLCTGFAAVAARLKEIDCRRAEPSRDPWPSRSELELMPLDQVGPAWGAATGRSLRDRVQTDEAPEGVRLVTVMPSELPGYYLLDAGRWALRVGLLVGLHGEDTWLQVGVLRGAQIHDGRGWYSFEQLGAAPRWTRVRRPGQEGVWTGLLLEETGTAGDFPLGLITEPVRWRPGDRLALEGLLGGRREARIARLWEATATFQHFALVPEPGAAPAPAGSPDLTTSATP
ncbi:hypothetical protein [Candidatus Methylocalor cossyra]|uniref:Uncharacterized protein n=1 Tax=Candidatus Methylocalor cossyra TaxID=3108543 RepID=A0ABP1C955_9GAMM